MGSKENFQLAPWPVASAGPLRRVPGTCFLPGICTPTFARTTVSKEFSDRCNVGSMQIPRLPHFFQSWKLRNLRAKPASLVSTSTSLAHSGDDEEDSIDYGVISLFFCWNPRNLPEESSSEKCYRPLQECLRSQPLGQSRFLCVSRSSAHSSMPACATGAAVLVKTFENARET